MDGNPYSNAVPTPQPVGGSTKASNIAKPTAVTPPHNAEVVGNVAIDIYGRRYDVRVPVFISLNDPSGFVIDRLVFDGQVGSGTSDYLVTVDSLVELRSLTKHKWGDSEHSYQWPDPDNPPSPGDDLYPFYEWLRVHFPGWPDNGGLQPQPGWGGGTPPITQEPVNAVQPSLSGLGFIGQPVLLDDGSWIINPAEIGRTRQWYFDGVEQAQYRGLTQITPVFDDWGKTVTATVTVENADGITTEWTSNSVLLGGVNPVEAHPDFDIRDGTGPSGWYLDANNVLGHLNSAPVADVFVQHQGIETTDVIIDATLIPNVTPADRTYDPYFLVIRWQDADNYIMLNLTATNAAYRVHERVAGVVKTLGTIPYDAGTIPHSAHINVFGANIHLEIDGNELDVTTTITESGALGVYSRPGQTPETIQFVKDWSFILLDDFQIDTPGTITGVGESGQVLTATDPTYSSPTGTTTRQWYRDGAQIPGETGVTYTTTDADKAKTITCRWTATDDDGYRTLSSESNAIYIVAPPVALTPPVIEISAPGYVQGGVLSLTHEGTWNTFGLPETGRTYQWYDGTGPVAGQTADTFDPVTVGSYRCQITVTTADGAISQFSQSIYVPLAIAPANVAAPTIYGTISTPSLLTCDVGTWAGDPSPTLTYQWTRDGVNIVGATTSTYTWTIDDDLGLDITCKVTGTNFLSATTVETNTLTPPINRLTPLTVAGAYGVGLGSMLTMTPQTYDHAPVGWTYEWRRDGTPIAGATGLTYWPTSADLDSVIVGRALPSYTSGAQPAWNNSTDQVMPATGFYTHIITVGADGNTNGVGVYGTSPGNFVYGSVDKSDIDGVDFFGTLSSWAMGWDVRFGPSSGAPIQPVSYVDGQFPHGLTEGLVQRMLPDADDRYSIQIAGMHDYAVTVIGHELGAIFKTDAAPVTNPTPPTITGPVGTPAGTLTCNPGVWHGMPTPTVAYQWQKNGVDISGATTSTYVWTIDNIDLGQTLTCIVTGTNMFGSLPVTSNELVPMIDIGPDISIGDGWSQIDATGHNYDYTAAGVQYPATAFGPLIAGATYRIRGEMQNITGSAPKLTQRLGYNATDLWNQTTDGEFDYTGLMGNDNDQFKFIINDNPRTSTADIRGVAIQRVEATVGDYNPYTLCPLWTSAFATTHRMENGAMVNASNGTASRGVFNNLDDVVDGWIECVFTHLNSGTQDGSFYLGLRMQVEDSANIDTRNGIGVRSLNNQYQIYDRFNDAWTLVHGGIPYGSGENRVRFEAIGNQVTLTVDGVKYGPYTTQVINPGAMGVWFRNGNNVNVEAAKDYTALSLDPQGGPSSYWEFDWTIGNDGTDYGFKRYSYGAIDPKYVDTREVTQIIADVDTGSALRLYKVPSAQFPHAPEAIRLHFDGRSIDMRWTGGNYENVDIDWVADLAQYDGQTLPTAIEMVHGAQQSIFMTVGPSVGDFIGFTASTGSLRTPYLYTGPKITELRSGSSLYPDSIIVKFDGGSKGFSDGDTIWVSIGSSSSSTAENWVVQLTFSGGGAWYSTDQLTGFRPWLQSVVGQEIEVVFTEIDIP